MRGKHRSLNKKLDRNISWIEDLPMVSKVVIGLSAACRHKYSPGVIRFKMDVDGGIKVNGYSGKGVTDIFIKIDPISQREQLKQIIKQRFSGTSKKG